MENTTEGRRATGSGRHSTIPMATEAPTRSANMLAVRMAQLQAWEAPQNEKHRADAVSVRGKQRSQDSQQTHVISQQMAGNMEEELPRRLPDVDSLLEDHRPQRPMRQLQQRCCAVGRCHQRRRRQQSLQRRGMVGRRLMAVARLAEVVGQTFRWSQHAGLQGGGQSACRSWRARLNLITPQSSHLIAANQSRHPEGRLQGLPRELGRTKIDKWVNWRIRTRKRPATQAKDMWLMARHGARRKSLWIRQRRQEFDVFVGIDRVYMVSRPNNHGTRWIYFGHWAGKTRRNEAPLEAVILHTRDTPCPWLIACDANMEPQVLCQSTAYNERFMCMQTPTTSKKRRW